MKKLLLSAAIVLSMAGVAKAENIGVTMALFDDNFLTVLRHGIQNDADKMGVGIQIQNAQNDVAKQLDQIKNFIASGVDGIIVNPVDTSATQAMTNAAEAAKVPLVYVNRQPINVDALPNGQAFVASNEVESGTLETKEVCRLLKAEGKTTANVYVIEGQLSNQAAVQRTKDIHNVINGPDCGVKINIIDEQTANWSRDQAQNLMTNWLSTGKQFDAVISNNDEMAIGAIQAMKSSGVDPKKIIVGGVDGTQDALIDMQAGYLNVTVFQNAAAQGAGALDAVTKLIKGEKVDKKVYVPFEMITPANMDKYLKKNKT